MTSQKPTSDPGTRPGDTEQLAKTKSGTSRLAIASLILGILILFPLYGPLFGIAAIISGSLALWLMTRPKNVLSGRTLAIAGIWLGALGIFIYPFILALEADLIRKLPRSIAAPVVRFTGMGMVVYGGVRYRVARVKADLRTIGTALEAYYRDHNSYPACAKGDAGANSFAGPHAGAYQIHTFRIWKNENEVGAFYTLTTPVAYLTNYFSDPWADTRGATCGYYADEHGWILYSFGLDTDENEIEGPGDLEPDVEQVYRSSISQPSLTLVAGTNSVSHEAYTYDVTNGTISAGDIWRVR